MQFNSSVTLEGFDHAVTATLRAATAAAVELAREELRERLRARWASEGQLFGPPWPPRHSPPGSGGGRGWWPLLQRTGRLRDSFLDPDNPEHVEILDASESQSGRLSLLWGSAVPYAAYHQFGTHSRFPSSSRRGPGGGLPARPILTPEVLQGIEVNP